ncbi:MAG: SGNH/GDSL hydrolase family protein [Flavobacteriales bacterium]
MKEATGTSGHCLSGSQNGKLEVLMIGESTFAGVGVKTHQEGFTGAFTEQLSRCFDKDIHWKVYARSGYTAKRVVYKILPKIEEKKTDIIMIGLGGNDAFHLTTPRKWRQDVTFLVASLQKQFPSTPLVFCNLPPIKLFPVFPFTIKFVVGNLVEILGEELELLVNQWDNVFFNSDVVTIASWKEKFKIKGDINDFFSDGLHPSQLTYQVWGKEMANVTAERFLPRLSE